MCLQRISSRCRKSCLFCAFGLLFCSVLEFGPDPTPPVESFLHDTIVLILLYTALRYHITVWLHTSWL